MNRDDALSAPRSQVGGFGWGRIVRLGLAQAGIGAVVVLATSTMSRLMTVELALPALVPGAFVGLHYVVQLARPGFGHGSDRAGGRGGFVVGGMAAAATGLVLAALGITLFPASRIAGLAAMAAGFVLLGLGVGACGTALLAALADGVAAARRGAAGAIAWFLMMLGFIVSAGVAGAALRPYSPVRLVEVCAAVGLVAVLLAVVAVAERRRPTPRPPVATPAVSRPPPSFRAALAEAWAEPHVRRFTGVVFLAMLAYAGQELVLEPLAGAVFGLSPAASTQLMGLQRGGVLAGMAVVGLLGTLARRRLRALGGGSAAGAMGGWTVAGCVAAAVFLAALAFGALRPAGFPLRGAVFGLGLADGVFAVAAVGAMMAGSHASGASGGGIRMGVWGAAQALAYAIGGLIATGALQAGRATLGSTPAGYGVSFLIQAGLFALAAVIMARPVGSARSASGARRVEAA